MLRIAWFRQRLLVNEGKETKSFILLQINFPFSSTGALKILLDNHALR